MKFHIEVRGSGGDYGIGSITKEQYDFWSISKNKKNLAEVLSKHDKSINTVPTKAKFLKDYKQHIDVGSCHGPEIDFAILTVTNEKGHQVFNGEYLDFKDQYESECEYLEIDTKEDDKNYLFWISAKKGIFYTATLELNRFEPEYLSFQETNVINEVSLLTSIGYANKKLKLKNGNLDPLGDEFILI